MDSPQGTSPQSMSVEIEQDHREADSSTPHVDLEETPESGGTLLMDVDGATFPLLGIGVLMTVLSRIIDASGAPMGVFHSLFAHSAPGFTYSNYEDGNMDSDSSSSSSSPTMPASPTPSFVRVFGWCTCEGCQERAQNSTHYPPDIREEKLRQYEEWNAARLKAIEKAKLERKERFTTHLVLKRHRALKVVGEMFGLDEMELREWDDESYGRWWEGVKGEVERRGNLGYEPPYSP
ncbi:hypothetical protein NMY22_g2947 [Coprinellus aureogranulatus]|nr:hypothetical protein NMY22_g2947 [Coprinellus aureogranulatus]